MYRISLLIWLVALAALNLTLLRYFEVVAELSPKLALLVGLMPLFDLFALSVYLALTRRFRFALVRRRVRGNLVDSAAMASGAMLALATLACVTETDVVIQLIEPLLSPVERWSSPSESSRELRSFVFGSFLGVLMSGPSVLFTLVLGYLHSRYKLEITRRGPA